MILKGYSEGQTIQTPIYNPEIVETEVKWLV
jgi:hypothetical protein